MIRTPILVIFLLFITLFIFSQTTDKLETVIQNGHNKSISKIVHTNDGKYCVSAGDDATIRFWDAKNGTLLRFFHGFQGRVEDIAVSLNEKYVAGASLDIIKIWDLTTGENIASIKTEAYIYALAFNKDSTALLAGGNRDNIFRYDLKTKKLDKEFKGHSHHIAGLTLSPSGNTLLSCSLDNTIKEWDIKSGNCLKTIKVEKVDTNSKLFMSQNRAFVLLDIDSEIVIYSYLSGKKIEIPTSLSYSYSAAFSYDNKYLACFDGSNEEYRLVLLNTSNFKEYNEIYKQKGYCDALSFNPIHNTIVTGSKDASLKIINLKSNEVKIFTSKTGIVSDFSLNNGKIAITSLDENVRIFNLNTESIDGQFEGVISSDFSPDGKLIASFSKNKKIIIRETKRYKVVDEFDGDTIYPDLLIKNNTKAVFKLRFSPDGENIIFTPGLRRVSVYNISQKKITKVLSGSSFDFSYDKKYLVIGDVYSVTLYDTTSFTKIETHKVVTADYVQDIYSVAISPDNRYIASSGEYDGVSLKILNRETKKIKSIDLDKETFFNIKTLKFTPDGKYIAVGGSGDSVIRLIRTEDGEIINTIDEHSATVNEIKFDNEGNNLISASYDGTINFRNMTNGQSYKIIVFNNNEWFIKRSDNTFSCSDTGIKYIKFIKGLNIYEPEQFWNDFFTVNVAVKKDDISKSLEEDTSINKIEDFTLNVPFVTIADPISDFETDKSIALIKVKVTPSGNGTGKVFLYRNGKKIDENTRGLKLSSKDIFREFTIELIEGENNIVAAAYDKDNRVEGKSESITIKYKPIKIEKPDMYIISVGVSNYKNQDLNLVSPVNDSLKFAQIFENVASSLYKKVYVTQISNEKATVANIKKTLNDTALNIKTSDTLIIFFAGHGYVYQSVYYFLTHETDETDLPATSLSVNDINNFLTVMPAQKIAIFFDTCQSGGAAKSIGQIAMSRSIEERMAVANLAKQRGIIVFASSSANEVSYEIKELGHGIFTYSLLDTVTNKKSEIAIDKMISISRLVSTVEKETRDIALQYLNIEQRPIKYNFGEDFSIGIIK